jgi:hypothetical protein
MTHYTIISFINKISLPRLNLLKISPLKRESSVIVGSATGMTQGFTIGQ